MWVNVTWQLWRQYNISICGVNTGGYIGPHLIVSMILSTQLCMCASLCSKLSKWVSPSALRCPCRGEMRQFPLPMGPSVASWMVATHLSLFSMVAGLIRILRTPRKVTVIYIHTLFLVLTSKQITIRMEMVKMVTDKSVNCSTKVCDSWWVW